MIGSLDYVQDALTDSNPGSINLSHAFDHLKSEQDACNIEVYDDFLRQRKFDQAVIGLGQILISMSITEATRKAAQMGIDSETYAEAFLYVSQHYQKEVEKLLRSGELSTTNLCLPGKSGANHEWLELNRFRNWARLLIPQGEYFFDISQIDYDELHRRGAYLFTNREKASSKTTELAEIVRGKVLLSLGVGAAADELELINNGARVIAVEGSSFMRDGIKKKAAHHMATNSDHFFNSERTETNKLYLPENPSSIFEVLEQLIQEDRKVDVVYSCSVLHFFDETTLKKLFKLLKQVVIPGGVIISMVKNQGVSLDGPGIKLCHVDEPLGMRSYLNPDGQIRHFRNLAYLESLVSSMGLQIIESDAQVPIQDYDVPGEQKFNYSKILVPASSL